MSWGISIECDAEALPIQSFGGVRGICTTEGAAGAFIPSRSGEAFQRQRDSLPAADAQRNDSLIDPVPLHRMQQTSREHSARRADRVTRRDGAAFDVDDIFG